MVDNTPSQGRTLAAGALSTRDVVVMALASSGPTQSVAVSLAAILATVAYAGFLPILMYYTVGTTSLTVPLGTYFLSFYSDPSVSHGDTVEAELAAASGPTAGPEAD